MDLWQRARGFAEEAAKRSQEISKEAAKRSQELTQGAAKFSQDFVSETAKKSKELAAEASKKADQIKIEALKRADQIKILAGEIPFPISPLAQRSTEAVAASEPSSDLVRFGVTDELREFVKGITLSTFRDFSMEDEPELSAIPTVSNVRMDLNEWQAKHATLVLSTVKEISKFRYELCPRYMKERKFWQIYFILVNKYVAPFEKQFMEESKLKMAQQERDNEVKVNETIDSASKTEAKETKLRSKSSTAEQDLDVFLLGDLGSSDEGPDDGDDGFDDDFDKIENSSALDSEDEEKRTKAKRS